MTIERRLRIAEMLAWVPWALSGLLLLCGFVVAAPVYKSSGLKVVGSWPASASVAQFGTTTPSYIVANWPDYGLNTYWSGSAYVAGTTGFGGRIDLNQSTGSMTLSTSAGSITAGAAISDATQLELATNGGGARLQNVTGSVFVKGVGAGQCTLNAGTPSTCTVGSMPSGSICGASHTTKNQCGVGISGTTATVTCNNAVTGVVNVICIL